MNRRPHFSQFDAARRGGSLGKSAASEGSNPRRLNWRYSFWLPSARTFSGSVENVKQSDAPLSHI
eukprot:7364762-Lingulodinium_polyedra.AAC.1